MAAGLVQIEPQSQEWLEQRKLGIGGSDCAAIFNEGYGCARALAYDKGDVPPDYERTERELRILRRGTLMEELVADEYAHVTGRRIRRMSTRVSKLFPFMRVNVDRQILGDKRGPGALEVKTASPWVYREMTANDPETGQAKGLPTQYVLQLQHALAVTNYDWGAFAVMNATSWELLTFEVERNEALIAEIIRREQEVWRMIQSGLLPQRLEKSNDKRCVNCQWRRNCRGESVIIPDDDREFAIDDSLAELATDYADAQDKIELYEHAAKNIREQLEQAIGDLPGVVIPSAALRIHWKIQKGRETWDSRALQSLVDGLRRIGADPMADKVAECKKVGRPTRPFRLERIEELP